MSEEMEKLNQQIAELSKFVQEHKGKEFDLQGVTEKMTELIEAQGKLLLALDQPQRKAPEGAAVDLAIESYKGKYARELRGIAKDGSFKVGREKVKAIDFIMAKALLEGAVKNGMPGVMAPSEDLISAVKALTTTGTGTGAELVSEQYTQELWEDFFAASRIVADLPNVPLTKDKDNIGGIGWPTWAKGAQGTATTASDPSTIGPDLTVTELIAQVEWTYDMDENSVIALMPTLRAALAASGAEQADAFALNADGTDAATGNINLDDADPAATMYYLSNGQDGIRHQFLVDKTTQGVDVAAAIDDAHMSEMLALLGKYALDPAQCRIVPDVKTYLSMLALTNVVTVDKYGQNATIVTGELARYRGIPVLPSASMPLTEADGKVSTTAANNVKGQIAAYNRTQWKAGFLRKMLIEADRSITTRKMILVASFKIAIGCNGTRSTAKHTAGAYDIS